MALGNPNITTPDPFQDTGLIQAMGNARQRGQLIEYIKGWQGAAEAWQETAEHNLAEYHAANAAGLHNYFKSRSWHDEALKLAESAGIPAEQVEQAVEAAYQRYLDANPEERDYIKQYL